MDYLAVYTLSSFDYSSPGHNNREKSTTLPCAWIFSTVVTQVGIASLATDFWAMPELALVYPLTAMTFALFFSRFRTFAEHIAPSSNTFVEFVRSHRPKLLDFLILEDAHYNDEFSRSYRKRFLYDPMFEGLNFKGKRILEAMCGSGQVTQYLIDRGAEVVGLDISEEVIESFKKRWPQSKSIRASFFDNSLEDKSFDIIVIVVGLHHVNPRVLEAIDEVHRLLKDDGYFCFAEPHAGCLPNLVRKIWYRFDKEKFAEGETAVDLEHCRRNNSSRFRFLKKKYVGNLAYLFVFNSMIFRIPLKLKRVYSSFFMSLESIIEAFHGKFFSCYSLSQWQKLPENKG